MFVINFIFGLIILIIGVIILRMNFQFTNLFGRNNIFERKLGPGSSYLIAKLFALLVMFIGFLVMFSLHDNLLDFLLTPVIDTFSI